MNILTESNQSFSKPNTASIYRQETSLAEENESNNKRKKNFLMKYGLNNLNNNNKQIEATDKSIEKCNKYSLKAFEKEEMRCDDYTQDSANGNQELIQSKSTRFISCNLKNIMKSSIEKIYRETINLIFYPKRRIFRNIVFRLY